MLTLRALLFFHPFFPPCLLLDLRVYAASKYGEYDESLPDPFPPFPFSPFFHITAHVVAHAAKTPTRSDRDRGQAAPSFLLFFLFFSLSLSLILARTRGPDTGRKTHRQKGARIVCLYPLLFSLWGSDRTEGHRSWTTDAFFPSPLSSTTSQPAADSARSAQRHPKYDRPLSWIFLLPFFFSQLPPRARDMKEVRPSFVPPLLFFSSPFDFAYLSTALPEERSSE